MQTTIGLDPNTTGQLAAPQSSTLSAVSFFARRFFPFIKAKHSTVVSADGREFKYLNPITEECAQRFAFLRDRIQSKPAGIRGSILKHLGLKDLHSSRHTESIPLDFDRLWSPSSGEGMSIKTLLHKYWGSLKSKTTASAQEIVGPQARVERVLFKNPDQLRQILVKYLKSHDVDPYGWGKVGKYSRQNGQSEQKDPLLTERMLKSRTLYKLCSELIGKDGGKPERMLVCVTEPGKPMRLALIKDVAIVDAVTVDQSGKVVSHLTERRRIINNTVPAERNTSPFLRSLGEKLHGPQLSHSGENPAIGVLRALDEEVKTGVRDPSKPVRLEKLEFINTLTHYGPSDDYFGLEEIGRYYVFKAVLEPTQFATRRITEEIVRTTSNNGVEGLESQSITTAFNRHVEFQKRTLLALIVNAVMNRRAAFFLRPSEASVKPFEQIRERRAA